MYISYVACFLRRTSRKCNARVVCERAVSDISSPGSADTPKIQVLYRMKQQIDIWGEDSFKIT